jgi:hypothetical protein
MLKDLTATTLITCFALVTTHSIAQTNPAEFNPDSSKSISASSFDSLVSNSILLLKTKKLSEISDSDQVNIMMCLNTVIFTISKPSFRNRFTDGKYQSLVRLSEEKDYSRNIIKIYPKWIANRGMGFYFPKLKMEVYGTPRAYAMFNVRYLEKGHVKLIDSISGNVFLLDTTHITISAFAKNGTIVWKTDPWKDSNLAIYRTARPVIVYFALGRTDECSWCKTPIDARVLWIEYDNGQIGFLV